jgi:hypothetical protein
MAPHYYARATHSEDYSLFSYYELILRIKPAVETFTNSTWEIPDLLIIRKWAKDYDERTHPSEAVMGYAYLAHLRHNGFPSPLLDWSNSPLVAAFFAFLNPQFEQVAIYAFSEMPYNSKVGSRDEARITLLGPYVQTHKRHFRQQSRYTICTKHTPGTGWMFSPHQEVFDRGMRDQDMTWKIIVPASERIKVLSELSAANINSFSLFDSEESLMEMLAVEEIELLQAKRERRHAARSERFQQGRRR